MENICNTISLENTYSKSAAHFLYRSHSAVLLKSEYLRLARKYARRSRKVGAQFDNGYVNAWKSFEAISDDLERLFYTIVAVEPANPILDDIHSTIEGIDDLAIAAFVRESNASVVSH